MKSYLKLILAVLMSLTFSGAWAADGELGPGDSVRINVYGHPDLSLETRISDTGSITFPLVGEIKLGGLSRAAAEKRLATALERGGYLRSPQVNIAVAQNQSQQVSIFGQVARPGRYPVEGKRSLTDILAMAGGMTPEAGDTVTLVRTRDGKTMKETLDIHNMVNTGDMHKNLELKTNDVIYVERAPRFYIYGEVQHPGTYKLERNMTVIQALSVGGGLSARGTDRGVKLKRRKPDGTIYEVTAKHEDIVQSDDVVYVRESLF
ncbi:polysaccharide export outer membrane protein [Paucimonas lemoignei]|uniref:Polysaccharide export outer membrane protein n=1 Tax=Paucimonas lemoignei TaxID=29443 RepID=A0A4R3I163_PAULE|nr:polysaccharide export protein EpsE [Paucimonas lemoignei]TCS39262.1 polysaccharide export outer membrane protein [Paucimonas lemoignei]